MRTICEENFSLSLLRGEMFPLEKISTHPPLLLRCSFGLFLPGLKAYSEDNTQHLPACLRARARESEVQGRGGGAYIQHASSRSSTHLLCVLHARVVYDLPKDCPTFRLSCLPSHFIASSSSFFSSVLLFRPSVDAFEYLGLGPAASRRPRVVGK